VFEILFKLLDLFIFHDSDVCTIALPFHLGGMQCLTPKLHVLFLATHQSQHYMLKKGSGKLKVLTLNTV
jgi:hypothetical protein